MGWRGATGVMAVAGLVAATVLAGCAVISLPAPTNMAQRMSQFPTRDLPLAAPVTIHWNAYQIPFVEAQDDFDGAFALGMVHAHLRLGQMEIARRIATGRISEMGGPYFADIDAALRAIGFARAADEILAAMPPDSRAWLERFVEGINVYRDRLPPDAWPHEFGILGLDKSEPWRPRDSIAIGRLAGTDINWLLWFRMLEQYGEEDFPAIYQRVVAHGSSGTTSFSAAASAGAPAPVAAAALANTQARQGSNSFVVAAARSASGAPLIASDPPSGLLHPEFVADRRAEIPRLPYRRYDGTRAAGVRLWAHRAYRMGGHESARPEFRAGRCLRPAGRRLRP